MYPVLMVHASVECDATEHCFVDNISNNWHNENVVEHLHIRNVYVLAHASFAHNFVHKRHNKIAHRSDFGKSLK